MLFNFHRLAPALFALLATSLLTIAATPVLAGAKYVPGPWANPGELGLRNDVRLLADEGVIPGIVASWPLSWGDLMPAMKEASIAGLDPATAAAYQRVMKRGRAMTKTGELFLNAHIAYAEEPRQIRTFEDSPRDDTEIGVGLSYTGDWLAINLQGQWVDEPFDEKDWRGDGSYIGFALGNWALAGQITDRWWGHGWQSNMIYSNNTRPIPAITLDRNRTDAFESKWLSWIGPWDFNTTWGWLENDRTLSNARFFAMRVDARPFEWLELAASRSAVWCGGGRSCDWDAFWDMFSGNDNRGQDVSADDEPGDQIAGYDLRVSGVSLGWPVAIYGQMIGEDTKDLLPSLFLTQWGIEHWGSLERFGNYRVYIEASDTLCGGNLTGSGTPDCGYNNQLQETGQRYRGRSFASTFDNDAKIFSGGVILNDHRDHVWSATAAWGELNRTGEFDEQNTVSALQADYGSIDFTHQRPLWIGIVDVGVGYEYYDSAALNEERNDFRFYLQWNMVL